MDLLNSKTELLCIELDFPVGFKENNYRKGGAGPAGRCFSICDSLVNISFNQSRANNIYYDFKDGKIFLKNNKLELMIASAPV